MDLLQEYRKANVLDHHTKERRSNSKWLSSDQDVIKINVDAATKVSKDKIGLGLVVRDNVGNNLLSFAKTG